MRLNSYLKSLKEENDNSNTIDPLIKTTIDKALSLEEPNGIIKHTQEFVEQYISLLNYAISLQKKEVIKKDDDKVSISILRDLEDKLNKWTDYKIKVLKIEDTPDTEDQEKTDDTTNQDDIDSELDKI